MSKAEQMGASPSVVSRSAESYSSPKQKTPEKTPEFDAERKCSRLLEKKDEPGSEAVLNELGDTKTVALQCSANDCLRLSSGYVTENPRTEGQKLCSVSEDEQAERGSVCIHDVPSNERDNETLENEIWDTNTELSSCPSKTLQSFPDRVPTLGENACNGTEVDESSYLQETTSGQALQVPCQPPDNRIKLGSGVEQSELAETSSGLSSHIAGDNFEPLPELVIKDSTEHQGLVSDGQIKFPAVGQSGLSLVNVKEHSKIEQVEAPSNGVRNSSRVEHRVKKTPKFLRKKYILRSSARSDRVLRSRSQEKSKSPQSSDNLANANSAGERKRKKAKRKKGNRIIDDEHSRIRKHLRYLLNRMNYEQSLISAYSGEGWKGLSLEKLKPEKELQRATSEILRRKLKIRDLFQRIDSLCAEGRFPESLFDPEGQISSEDIFCAKCGSKDLTVDNDIILCDGACDRGFHQFCLVPPLLKEDIPPDDEGWLCPGCDCKVDCVDLLNDNQGTDLSINDNWEKVFPEAAAGQNGGLNSGLPSDDSDDDDYDPDGPKIDERSRGDNSSSDESDFSSASEELEAPPNDKLGLSSDDSEDDDYDPDAPDVDEKVKMESSGSDFTSDSEDLTTALDNNELSGAEKNSTDSDRQRTNLGGKQSTNSELYSILDPDVCNDGSALVSGKRNAERLDYKKLYEETYGNASSSSSDDEDYSDSDGPSKRRKKSTDDAPVLAKENATGHMNPNPKEARQTSERRTRQKSNVEVIGKSPAKPQVGTSPSSSSGKRVRSSAYRRLGEAITQRLHSAFKENQYPDRPTKESLAKELGISFQQVDKWFGNARWSFYHSSSMAVSISRNTSETDDWALRGNDRPVEPEAKSNKDAPFNRAVREESCKAGVAVSGSCSVDQMNTELKHQEGNKRKYETRKLRKR